MRLSSFGTGINIWLQVPCYFVFKPSNIDSIQAKYHTFFHFDQYDCPAPMPQPYHVQRHTKITLSIVATNILRLAACCTHIQIPRPG
jgi:hypothetical protein